MRCLKGKTLITRDMSPWVIKLWVCLIIVISVLYRSRVRGVFSGTCYYFRSIMHAFLRWIHISDHILPSLVFYWRLKKEYITEFHKAFEIINNTIKAFNNNNNNSDTNKGLWVTVVLSGVSNTDLWSETHYRVLFNICVWIIFQ